MRRGSDGTQLTELSKDDAHREAIRRWHALPESERETYMQARVFAAGLADELQFRSMTDRRKLIEAWLIEDMDPRVRDRPKPPPINDPLAIPSDASDATESGDTDGADQG